MEIDVQEEQETITVHNIKKNISLLEKKIQKNQQDRIEFPDTPQRWIKSEVDLDEQIRLFRDISTLPELFDSFYHFDGLKLFSDCLSHPNIDIVMTALNVLAEMFDPEIILGLELPELFINSIESLRLHEMVVSALLKIDEDNGEIDYEGVKSCMELLESFLELIPSLVTSLASNEELLSFLLKRIKSSKTLEYDSNRIHASELLCILLQESRDCRRLIANRDTLDGLDKLLKCIAIYRKKDPECVEEEELLENVFQCLCYLMFESENQLIFASLQGIKFAIRLIKERRFAYRHAIKLLDYALLDSVHNCAHFVESMGLKSVFSVLMRKGVTSKLGSEDEKQEDEHVIGILNSLCAYCTGTELARILNKFAEHKYEKLERLIEMHEKYTNISKNMLKTLGKNKHKDMYNMLNMDQETQTYLDMYEAGLSICQLIDCLIIRIYNMGNRNLSTCLLLLLHNKGIDIQDIYNNISDYLEHLSEEASDTRTSIDKYLKNFLTGASDSGLFQ